MASPASKTLWYFSTGSFGNSKTAAMAIGASLVGTGELFTPIESPADRRRTWVVRTHRGCKAAPHRSVQAAGQPGEAAAIVGAELGPQRGDVLFHRARRQEQPLGDLAVGQPVTEQVEHLGLAHGDAGRGQRGGQAGVGGPPPRRGLTDRKSVV